MLSRYAAAIGVAGTILAMLGAHEIYAFDRDVKKENAHYRLVYELRHMPRSILK